MSDLGPDIVDSFRVKWTAERMNAAEAGARSRRRRRAIARATLAGATLIALIAFGRGVIDSDVTTHAPTPAFTVAAAASNVVHLADGSTVEPAISATVEVVEQRADRITVALVAGSARFQIAPNGARAFRVLVADTVIAADNATFTCQRVIDRVRIDVIGGSVQVRSSGEQHDLQAGAAATFPPDRPHEPAPPIAIAPPAPRSPQPKHIARESWRDLARGGEFDRAWTALSRPDAPALRDEPDELLLAADVARLSHHPADAIAPLRRVLRDHVGDPRAPLAAFTLGRVLLEELDRPADAASAFAEVDRLAPDGPLAEDAVAREVEAFARAGDVGAANRAADEYLRRFPNGRKARLVRQQSGQR